MFTFLIKSRVRQSERLHYSAQLITASPVYNPVQTDAGGDGKCDVCDPVAEENTGESCRDGIDNDEDGVADGHDTGCNQVLYEPYETTCNDGIDNDADSLTDMQDPSDCNDDTVEYGGEALGRQIEDPW